MVLFSQCNFDIASNNSTIQLFISTIGRVYDKCRKLVLDNSTSDMTDRCGAGKLGFRSKLYHTLQLPQYVNMVDST